MKATSCQLKAQFCPLQARRAETCHNLTTSQPPIMTQMCDWLIAGVFTSSEILSDWFWW